MYLIREEILIDGNVQAVGFRPFQSHTRKSFETNISKGFIKCLAEKKSIVGVTQNIRPVKIICEGEEEIVNSFLREIRESTPEYINIVELKIFGRNPINKLSFESFEIIGEKEDEITLKHIDDRLQTGVNVMVSMNNKLNSIEKGQNKMIELLEKIANK